MQTTPASGRRFARPVGVARPSGDGQVVAELDQVKGVGDTLNGRFVLEECLGVGGMGTVYKALDLRKLEASDRKPYVAIKVLNLQFRGNPKSLIALQREARKAQTLAHPEHRHRVRLRPRRPDRLSDDGVPVRPAAQRMLRTRISRACRSPRRSRSSRAWRTRSPMRTRRGFVHCDFKPANVFLTDTAEVKVIDFGIARVFQRPEEETEATIFDPGSLGALTPAYASPEMLEHREPDPRDDIYALGCITYELLTGKHPFDRVPATAGAQRGHEAARARRSGQQAVEGAEGGARRSTARRARRPSRSFSTRLSEDRPAPPRGRREGRRVEARDRRGGVCGGALRRERAITFTISREAARRPRRKRSPGQSEGSATGAVTPHAPAPPAPVSAVAVTPACPRRLPNSRWRL